MDADLAGFPRANFPHPNCPHASFLDCDTGIDDALAIAYLIASPSVDLVGVGAVSGNLAAADGARNTLDLLSLLGRPDIPVAVGAHDFLSHPFSGGAPHVHGRNGIGDITLPPATTTAVLDSAAELLVRMARRYPGELRVLAIGPLTNLALALRLEPELPSLVREVTLMGGAALVPGNVSPVAEANIANDPEAADEVFAASWDITMVGLDVTMEHRFEERHRDQLRAAGTPVTVALADMLGFYYAFYEPRFGRPSAALHDPLAAAVADGGVKVSSGPRVDVVVDHTDGPGRGQTIADLRGMYSGFSPSEVSVGRVRVVLGVDENFADILLDRLCTL